MDLDLKAHNYLKHPLKVFITLICLPYCLLTFASQQNMQKHQCVRSYDFMELERAKRFELSTFSLATRCSTTELRPLNFVEI